MARFRECKNCVRDILESDNWLERLPEIHDYPPAQVIGPLFSMLLHAGNTRWRAIATLGRVVAGMAEQSPEEARVVMRRLIWNLNEESGNVAWGAPETLGEICAASPKLAREYHKVLLSYIMDTGFDDNFLDHPPLRRGAVWAAARLAQVRPELARGAIFDLVNLIADPDDHPTRGLAAWGLTIHAAGLHARTDEHVAADAAKLREALPRLMDLADDQTEVEYLDNNVVLNSTNAALAAEAAKAIKAMKA